MKKKITYRDKNLGMGKRVKDFLPPPEKLVKREETVKVTLELTKHSLSFFKEHARKNSVPYQRMLRGLIDAYVRQQT